MLPQVSDQLRTYAAALARGAGRPHRSRTSQRFLDAQPDWKERLEPQAARPARRRGPRGASPPTLLGRAGVRSPTPTAPRMTRTRAAASSAPTTPRPPRYRMEVRLGVVLRMRALLTRSPAASTCRRYGTADERAEPMPALRRCEDLESRSSTRRAPRRPTMPAPARFPPCRRPAAGRGGACRRGWASSSGRSTDARAQARATRPPGAVTVMTVYPGLARRAAAGLEVGDVILGPPGQPFHEPQPGARVDHAARDRRARADRRPARAASRCGITLHARALPARVARAARSAQGRQRRAAARPEAVPRQRPHLAAGKPRLLFFWATWCRRASSRCPR